jgi:hypothetical protein
MRIVPFVQQPAVFLLHRQPRDSPSSLAIRYFARNSQDLSSRFKGFFKERVD